MKKYTKQSKPESAPMREVFVSLFKSTKDNKPTSAKSWTWDDFSAQICAEKKRVISHDKTKVPLASFAKFDGTRGNAKVKMVSALMYDFDSGVAFQKLSKAAGEFEFVAHSTFSHTREKEKYRMILPLSRPVSADEYKCLWGVINTHLGSHADSAARDPARINYLPSCPPENKDIAFSYHNKGEFLNPDIFLAVSNSAEGNAASGERPDMKRGYPDTQRTNELTRRIGWCNADGLSTEETIEACLKWNAHNTPPLPDEKIIATVKNMMERNAEKLTNDPWGDLVPLITESKSASYPVQSLPSAIRDAVAEVQAFVQAPMALVASSALAAISIAGQASADVQRGNWLEGPISLSFLNIAESGERKSSLDRYFFKVIREYEEEQQNARAEEIAVYQAKKKEWDIKEAVARESIKDAVRNNQSAIKKTAVLEKLEKSAPKHPKLPRFTYSDPTPEALISGLAKHWPTAGLVSSEAGIVFGGHGMKNESLMYYLSTLNLLWDGSPLQSDRKTSGSISIRGARLTVALQIQEATLRNFFDRSGELARGNGFLARFLIANPDSTQGTRFYREREKSWPILQTFHDRLRVMLSKGVDADGNLSLSMLTLSTKAKEAWVQFYNLIEKELGGGGAWSDVKDVASKTCDNAARIAALFHLFDNKSGTVISVEHMTAACEIAVWYLQESKRFFNQIALPEDLSNAAKLEQSIIAYCKKKGLSNLTTRQAQQFCRIRDGKRLNQALGVLQDHGHLRVITQNRRRDIILHPGLLK